MSLHTYKSKKVKKKHIKVVAVVIVVVMIVKEPQLFFMKIIIHVCTYVLTYIRMRLVW